MSILKDPETVMVKTNYKIVIRCLPPTLSAEKFMEQVSPLPEHDYYYYVQSRVKFGVSAYSRAYINFLDSNDLYIFKEKFDGYVFLDVKGNEYYAIVEFAPFQKIPKKKSKKIDVRKGTIEIDPDYQKFLDQLENPEPEEIVTAATILQEIETKELRAKEQSRMVTPLIEHIRKKREERRSAILRSREEARQRDLDRRRQREEMRLIRDERYRRDDRKPVKKFTVLKKDDSDDSADEKQSKNYMTASYMREKQLEKERAASSKREQRIKNVKRDNEKDADERRERDGEKTKLRDVIENSKDRRKDKNADEHKNGNQEKDMIKKSEKTSSSKDSILSNSEDKKRIRNKDRPERALYVPGRRNPDRSKSDVRLKDSTWSSTTSSQSTSRRNSNHSSPAESGDEDKLNHENDNKDNEIVEETIIKSDESLSEESPCKTTCTLEDNYINKTEDISLDTNIDELVMHDINDDKNNDLFNSQIENAD